MKIVSVENAILNYLEGCKKAKEASEQFDFKTNDIIIKNQINPAFEYLKEKNKLDSLIQFLRQDKDIDLKQSTAVALLPYFEKDAVEALEKIIGLNIANNSFTAKMVLEQWRSTSEK